MTFEQCLLIDFWWRIAALGITLAAMLWLWIAHRKGMK